MLRLVGASLLLPAVLAGGPWQRHTIDDSSRGADGVRLADVNGDELPDIAVGWEQGGKVRIYLNPGPQAAKQPWPAVTVGNVASPEDAVFVDLNGDGAIDVVSATEGKTRTLFLHRAPRGGYRDASAWTTSPLRSSKDITQWMFVLPLDTDGRGGIDLVAGSKNQGASVGVWRSPLEAGAGRTWQPWYEAGWIMSLVPHDIDGDGDIDVVATDRKGEKRGALWFENPASPEPWKPHRIGPLNRHEIMFLDVADLDVDGLDDVVAAVREGPILFFRRLPGAGVKWETHEISMPPGFGTGKSVAVGDIDLDGSPDIVFSCENAQGALDGVGLLRHDGDPLARHWRAEPIGGPQGAKFDLVELLDLDRDGDLDVLTCEESDLLGVIWYENPANQAFAETTH